MSLPSKHHIAAAFNRAAFGYDKHASLQREATNLLIPTILPKLYPHATLLDLGCGTGYLGHLLRNHTIPYQLFQLDIAANMCQIAHLPSDANHHTIQGDIEYLPIRTGSMSIIASSMTFQWLTQLPSAFSQIRTLLKPDGIFTCILVGDGSLHELITTFSAHEMHAPINPFPTQQQLEQALRQAGMEQALIYRKKLITSHPTLVALLRYFKELGADYAFKKHPRNIPLRRGHLQQMDAYYRNHYGEKNNLLETTWNLYSIQWTNNLSA